VALAASQRLSRLARGGFAWASSGDDLAGNGEPQAAVGDKVHDEPAEAGELGAVEDEHLRDEDPHQEAAHEPVIGGRPGAAEAQDASADERRASDRRGDLRDRRDGRSLGHPTGGSLGGDESDGQDRHRGVGDNSDAQDPCSAHGFAMSSS